METLEKLRPDRDLQCYFERPSAIAAISEAGPEGLTVSGCWRQQFDWAVVEWNRDNVFEHPAFRSLPDGDLSGLSLSYEETRENAIRMDADWYPTVDWPHLRIWASSGGTESLYKVKLLDHATAVEGSFQAATAEFELQGAPAAGDAIGVAWAGEHHTYTAYAGDTADSVLTALTASVNAFSPVMSAVKTGSRIRLSYDGAGNAGANGNRVGAYAYSTGAAAWAEAWKRFSGGQSPVKWRVDLNFGSLTDTLGRTVPAGAIRKMRWTWAADIQEGAFQRSEFRVRLSNWTVSGTGRAYRVAGPGSQRVEDDSGRAAYSGSWDAPERGNYSGGSIRSTASPGAGVECRYRAGGSHEAYLGTRLEANGAQIAVTVDNGPARTWSLEMPGEDALVRLPLGTFGAGEHVVSATHTGLAGRRFHFDFVEAAAPANTLPAAAEEKLLTTATDWDTDHSIALAPERTAWMIASMGFRGRVNHYCGALWFYELARPGQNYAWATVDFTGTPAPSEVTWLTIGGTLLEHLNHAGDTAELIAKAFEMQINQGSTAVRAVAAGARLTITARGMGAAGNSITLAAGPSSGGFQAAASGASLSGGTDGAWRTDLTATPRWNRAARDWHRSFFAALRARGLDATAALSMELQHGDASEAAGIAQRYPGGGAVMLATPAVQTNFSPASLAFWKQAFREMAGIMAEAGCTPYLQFGETQWWYFPDATGMPFHDAYTKAAFQAVYGFPMRVIPDGAADPALFPQEAAFLPGLIGAFTSAVTAFVREAYPGCRFEALYPPDVNEGRFNRVVNFPAGQWTPATLECLKTESFTYTFERNLEASKASISWPAAQGFPPSQRSHLVGAGDALSAWLKEARLAEAQGAESVVLFALDQFCLIGYQLPLWRGMRRSGYSG